MGIVWVYMYYLYIWKKILTPVVSIQVKRDYIHGECVYTIITWTKCWWVLLLKKKNHHHSWSLFINDCSCNKNVIHLCRAHYAFNPKDVKKLQRNSNPDVREPSEAEIRERINRLSQIFTNKVAFLWLVNFL